jgi:hypothetical protein
MLVSGRTATVAVDGPSLDLLSGWRQALAADRRAR